MISPCSGRDILLGVDRMELLELKKIALCSLLDMVNNNDGRNTITFDKDDFRQFILAELQNTFLIEELINSLLNQPKEKVLN